MRKELRIKKAEEFQSIIEKKQSDLNAKYVIYHQKKATERSRVGISVGKKLANAVNRNKTKRQIRMMVSEILKDNYSFDAIIIVRYKYFKSNYKDNLLNLKQLFDLIEKRRYSNEKFK